MSATVQTPRPASLNRRRRVRQKVHAPAYATFGAASKGEMLDLYEVAEASLPPLPADGTGQHRAP